MSKILKLTVMMAFMLGLMVSSPSESLASNFMPVVTKDNHFVIDRNGNCIRTMFMADTDACKKHVDVIVMDERVVFFGFDSAMLDDEEKMKLNKLAKTLMDRKITKVQIVGYTDKIGSEEYNQKLSEKRAHSVKHYLDNKVSLDSSPVVIRGMGEKNEVKLCKGKYGDEAIKCLAPNRRVEVEIDYYDMIR